MRGPLLALTLLLSTVAGAGNDAFEVKPASEYAARQQQGGVTVAVKAYSGEEEQKEAFGKAQPYKYGFLPVLVVITNDGDHPLGLKNLKARFIDSRGDGLEPISAEDLAYFNPKGHQPKDRPSYIPIPLPRPKAKKGPLAKIEISQREFQAPVVPPKSTASGFFYYNTGTGPQTGSAMYISGIHDMASGSELFYFEIPLGTNE